MEKTTSRKLARARLLEARQAAAAEREARERANIGDLTEFTVQCAKVDEVDQWLAARMEKLRAEAEQRRQRHRVAAGNALQAMRLRGETVPGIAAQAGLSQTRVREYLKMASAVSGQAADVVASVDGPDGQVVVMPTRGAGVGIGHEPARVALGAQ